MFYSKRFYFGAIVTGLAIFACTSSATIETNITTAVPGATFTLTQQPQEATITSTQETESPTITPTQEPTKSSIGKVGDTITQGDYIITLVNVEKAKSYNEYFPADEGKIFIAVEIIIESGADSGVSVNPLYCQLTDGDSYSYTITMFGKDPSLSSQNDLPKGEKMRGWVTFEVPETAKDFIFSYEPMSFIDKIRIRFYLGI